MAQTSMGRGTATPRPVHRSLGKIRLLLVFVLVALRTGGFPDAHASPMVPSIGVLPFPGDVYTLGLSGTLIAVDASQTPVTASLFNIVGSPLNVTWGAWSAASATTSVREHGSLAQPRTTVQLKLTGLIPHGVYSVFYRSFGPDSNNSLCPNIEPSLVLGTPAGAQPGDADGTERDTAVDGAGRDRRQDAAAFTADGRGDASVRGTVSGHLLDAQRLQFSVIYHLDGQTYGALANRAEAASAKSGTQPCLSSYGIDAMRQVLIIQK